MTLGSHLAGALDEIPWSRAGSSMALSRLVPRLEHPGRDVDVPPGLYLLDVSGSRLWRWNGVFRLSALVDGATEDPALVEAAPERLVLRAGAAGSLHVAWDGTQTLRVRGEGAGLRLAEAVVDPLDAAVALATGPGAWRLQMGGDTHFALEVVSGTATVSGPRVRTGEQAEFGPRTIDVLPDADGVMEVALTQYANALPHRPARTFEDCVDDVRAEVARWSAAFGDVEEPGLSRAAATARYVLWSATTGPRGLLGRPAVLMSKNWMNAVWSWDHCFNAIGLARAHPATAWHQYLLPFDHQDTTGALPDLVHDAGRGGGFVKPPVHGWAFRQLDALAPASQEQAAAAYRGLAAWTRWWLDQRDVDGDGLCEYFHGCDSGQDNSTAFDMGFPATSPDLAAFLVLQLEVLAELAPRVGASGEAEGWRSRAEQMTALLLDRLWDGRRFRAVHSLEGTHAQASRSQVPFQALLLGPRLPQDVRDLLVDDLRTSGLVTPHGLASESPLGPCFEDDGYWRGAVWAPTNLLVVDGLEACGEHALALDVARGFARSVVRSGCAENYSALDGRALKDPAYTWSAAVFLHLLATYGAELAAGSG